MNLFSSLHDKIKDLTLNLKDFNKMVSFLIEDRTKKLTNRLSLNLIQDEKKLKNSYQIEAYYNIRKKLVENSNNDELFEKKLVKLYKDLKELSNFLTKFENSYINLIINNFSSNDILHLKVNLLMKEFNNQIDNSLL